MQAFAFIRQLTLYAQKHNHDPEWFNVYYRADMTLTTHDVGGLSQRDIDVAIYSDQAFDRISSQTGTH